MHGGDTPRDFEVTVKVKVKGLETLKMSAIILLYFWFVKFLSAYVIYIIKNTQTLMFCTLFTQQRPCIA